MDKFLIGKKLASLNDLIANQEIDLIITEQLILEIQEVTGRKKLEKYFSKKDVKALIKFLDIIAYSVEIRPKHFINRDPKDNFLLDLIDFSAADYLITGDKDLLMHNPFKTAKIFTPNAFERLQKN